MDITERVFKIQCANCNIRTNHQPYDINIRKGVKLRCMACGLSKKGWHNLIKLEEKEVKNG